MPDTLYLQRKMNALYASDGLADSDLSKLPEGVRLKAVITRPRSVPHHRLYWSMLQLVVENCESIRDAGQLHDLIKIRLGYCDPIQSAKTGDTYLIPRSIAFGKMDQTEFNEFFGQAADFINEEVIPGIGRDTLKKQAQQMLGTG